jgi:hypothetical protein
MGIAKLIEETSNKKLIKNIFFMVLIALAMANNQVYRRKRN